MDIKNLAHILRACKSITNESVFVIVGSQAILAQFPDAPDSLKMSMEIDMYPRFRPDLSEVIEGALGANSSFHRAFGYFADGVGPETATLPIGWMKRSIEMKGHPLLEGAVAICPEINDLCASKMAAFRDKDLIWVEAVFDAGLAKPEQVIQSIKEIEEERMPMKASAIAWVSKFIPGDCENDCNDIEP